LVRFRTYVLRTQEWCTGQYSRGAGLLNFKACYGLCN
jgi:hypothetical protein